VARAAQQIGSFLTLVISTDLLALAMLSVGVLISVICRRSAVAVGVAILVWFALVFLTDLGLIGSTIAFRMQVREILRRLWPIRCRSSRCRSCKASTPRWMCWGRRGRMPCRPTESTSPGCSPAPARHGSWFPLDCHTFSLPDGVTHEFEHSEKWDKPECHSDST
jgi:hypothetical protein